jgi:hypothetical protein
VLKYASSTSNQDEYKRIATRKSYLFKLVLLNSFNSFNNSIEIASIASIPKKPTVLHTLKAKQHFNYINEHFPVFPDPHTYIVSEVKSNTSRDYFKVREMIAKQKLSIETSMVNFELRKHLLENKNKNLSLFNEPNDSGDKSFMRKF